MIRLTEHFTLDEFRCECCRKVEVAYVIPYLLERIRLVVGDKVIVTSGYRCEEHNREIGGAEDSLHTTGRAVDIITPGYSSKDLARLAYRTGFYTCIYYPVEGHTHCQLRGRARKGLYLHTEDNKYIYEGEPK